MRMTWVAVAVLALGSCTPNKCEVSPDDDHDGYVALECGGTDCDDNDFSRHPSAFEVCDQAGHDEDCDPNTFGVRDVDGDGHTDSRCSNTDGAGMTHHGDDCDDNNPGVNPDAPEVCNEIDDDCDSTIDEGVRVTLYTDADHDGYGAGVAMMGCFAEPGLSDLGNDCDDANAAIVPGAMKCVSTFQYQICDSATGMFTATTACPTQQTCHAQPNGTGVCI